MKSKISLGLLVILTVLTLSNVFAVDYIMNLSASYNGRALDYEEEIVLENSNTNRTLTVNTDAKYVDDTLTIYYTMGKGTRYTVSTGKKSATMQIPGNLQEGMSYWIGLEAVSNNTTDNYVGNSNIFYVKVTVPQTAETTTAEVSLKDNGSTVSKGATINKNAGDKLTVEATSNKGIKQICYQWNKGDLQYVSGSTATITIPSFEAGTKQRLDITAETKDGRWAQAKTYYIQFPDAPVAPVDDDLIVEDWMKENKDLEGVAVSLRNDSDEYEKENKNMYALKEEVVYYVDYKNNGKDINQEVKLVLELPLEFNVVDAFGGKVDKDKKTITWTMDGLEKEASGTKVVKVKYTSLGKSSKKSAVVYPVAKLYVGSAKSPKDISAVINLIFKDEDTVLSDEHNPYMFGDKNKNTFRPDDSITRAEGALVLARIFGINYSGTQVNGNEYSDIEDTYLEAQKAIVASTKLGIINGYTDGSFKPNKEMTKAEFMKIIASYVEVKAEEDYVKGLEVKDLEDSIKLYKNPTNVYVMGGNTVDSHWAINYVTLLARINMTSVSSSHKNLGLDEDITRAEVAQLVNFYLLRAPAEGGKIQFSDVARNHKLYADILEATRPSHSFTLTHEGTEIAED